MSDGPQELCDYLDANGVEAIELDRKRIIEVERNWRAVFGDAFDGQRTFRVGTKAESEYQQLDCSQYWIVALRSKVAGTPVQPTAAKQFGFECRGKLVSLARFHSLEFFVSPLDFAWTMLHTHEDHASGGPYFARRDAQ